MADALVSVVLEQLSSIIAQEVQQESRAKAVEGRIHQTLDGSAERLANDTTSGSSSDASPPNLTRSQAYRDL
ncbi:hypothetical protein DKX38_027549 [Salix brachista]|uniref:Uncharacterized protein n=1 Tax=Salix brachista TaxID=2182728 RepID=A0A5N5J8P3_9ROSI|nr:hypothetical protein DKX38_027549 [Salix brachista]